MPRSTRLRWTIGLPLLALLGASALVAPVLAQSNDPDLPGDLGHTMDRTTYLRMRDAYVGRIRGVPYETPYNPRLHAIEEMMGTVQKLAPFTLDQGWIPIGPAPIPNGQTTGRVDPVTGRVTAIAVHPTNPDIVYVGTAQGGVYRSLNGGATWIPIFDQAFSLAIGALSLAPSNPSILYVGTGEGSFSLDSFFGVGLYRIDFADTAPVLNGPINPPVATGIPGTTCFTGRSISKILVHPTNPDTIFVATTSGYSGLSGDQRGGTVPPLALRGIYRSWNATSGNPAFEMLTVTSAGSIAPSTFGDRDITDMVYAPADSDTILCWVRGSGAANDGGLYRTLNARLPVASVLFSQVLSDPNPGAWNRAALTIMRGSGTDYAYLAIEERNTGGNLWSSVDAGATWAGPLAGGLGFCNPQCWYDMVVAVRPDSANTVLIGGSGNDPVTGATDYAISYDGGATFNYGRDVGLHADCHAIAFAPSSPNIVYHGNDGGVWKSTNGGINWASLNNSMFSATQFQSLALHPLDRRFTIGGTQDNGTNWFRPDSSWYRVDWGDGGYSAIDQNAVNNTNVTMYHTYFNATNFLLGFARVGNVGNARDNLWGFYGWNNGASNNGINGADNVLFYAPLVLGPGNPNTVYFGTDRLYRSTDRGNTMSVVSQAPLDPAGQISAIAISPQNDAVRLVGMTNGRIFGTVVAGATTLTEYSVSGMPARYIGRIAIDPTNASVAYVTYNGYGETTTAGLHVWKTTNLLSGVPTWTVSGIGIPDVPVNAFVVDPANPNQLYAGTDIGVFMSSDGGAIWSPYNTGLPIVAVFDMAIQAPHRVLRIATHGRGMWQRDLGAVTAVAMMVVGAEIENGCVRLTWYLGDYSGPTVTAYRRPDPGDWSAVATITSSGAGQFVFVDDDVVPGRRYEYRLGIRVNGREELGGAVWVDVPARGGELALRGVVPNPSRNGFRVTFRLTNGSPATIELVDVTGRRVEARDVGVLGVGEHEVDLARARRLSPGVYWVRLSQAGRSLSRRVAIVR